MPKFKKNYYNQRGIASIIVVSVLVILLSLISIGFSRLINRDVSKSVEEQKSQVASYAAESGINQIINYIRQGNPLAATNHSDCQNKLLSSLNSSTGLSGDKNTEYTCALLNLTPSELGYDKLPPMSSKVIQLKSTAPLTDILVSWRAANGDNGFVTAGSSDLLDETTWGQKGYVPMLRLTLYSIPSNNSLGGPGYSARTFFLYPRSNRGATTIDWLGPQSVTDGSLVPLDCNDQKSINKFDYQSPGGSNCSVIIDNLPNTADSGSYYYARIMPIYGAADFTLAAHDTNSKSANGATSIKFIGVQGVIDVTAKSNDVVKRLLARVDLSGLVLSTQINNLPEFALRSADTICKRYVVQAGSDTLIDPAGAPNLACGGVPIKLSPKVPIAVTQPATNITNSSVYLNGTVQPNDTKATYYYEYAPGATPKSGEKRTQTPSPPADMNINRGTGYRYPEPHKVNINLTPSSIYHFRICALNSYSQQPSCGQFLTFGLPKSPECDPAQVPVQNPNNFHDCPPPSSSGGRGGSSSLYVVPTFNDNGNVHDGGYQPGWVMIITNGHDVAEALVNSCVGGTVISGTHLCVPSGCTYKYVNDPYVGNQVEVYLTCGSKSGYYFDIGSTH